MKAMYIDAPGQVSIKDVESRATSSPLRLSRQMRTMRMASSRE